MGAHRIVTASTLFLQPPQPDSTPKTRQPSAGIACERLSAALRYKLRLDLVLEGLE